MPEKQRVEMVYLGRTARDTSGKTCCVFALKDEIAHAQTAGAVLKAGLLYGKRTVVEADNIGDVFWVDVKIDGEGKDRSVSVYTAGQEYVETLDGDMFDELRGIERAMKSADAKKALAKKRQKQARSHKYENAVSALAAEYKGLRTAVEQAAWMATLQNDIMRKVYR